MQHTPDIERLIGELPPHLEAQAELLLRRTHTRTTQDRMAERQGGRAWETLPKRGRHKDFFNRLARQRKLRLCFICGTHKRCWESLRDWEVRSWKAYRRHQYRRKPSHCPIAGGA